MCSAATSLIIVGSGDACEWLEGLGTRPILRQLLAMVEAPLRDDRGDAAWQAPFEKCSVLESHERLVPLIGNMDVGRRVICVVHADRHAEERRDDGHGPAWRTPRIASSAKAPRAGRRSARRGEGRAGNLGLESA